MTTEAFEKLREQISTLSESERAELAREFVMSLDGPCDQAVEQSWDDEIVRRVSQVKEGRADVLTREEFQKKMDTR
ncbi:MAG: addiction module protein [Spiribacter salinus]|uniref:Addiction module protein n=1 Tax=Spiribacter salinus TaxID=1335746 RepID=A0A540VNL5_9GAMM|nr:MAG: addiction module protein [Spiribacter salinus]